MVQGRLLAGIFATYTSWRDTYWFAVATQGGESSSSLLANAEFTAMLGGLWLALPDTPHKDIGLSYPQVVSPLRSVGTGPTANISALVYGKDVH